MSLTEIIFALTTSFGTVNNSTTNLTEIQEFYKRKEIIYPALNSKEFDIAFRTIYTSPQTTLKRGYGVCDDLSLLTAYLLLSVPYITEIDLIQVRGKPGTHAYLVFQDENGLWGYANNTLVSDLKFKTKGQALLQPLKECGMGYNDDNFKISERKINHRGAWVYNNERASELQPTTEHPTTLN